MTTAVFLPVPYLWSQVFTDAGVVGVGYQIFIYQAGTTVPITTFTDSTLTTQNPNPIQVSSNGRLVNSSGGGIETWVPAGTLAKVFLTDSTNAPAPGVPISGGLFDNIAGINDPTGITTNQFPTITNAEQLAGVTPVNFLYPPGYADRYGFNSVPGTTDMTSAIQAAVNVAAIAGSNTTTAVLLANTYFISSAIVVSGGVTLRGQGGSAGAAGAAIGTNLIVNSNITAVQLGTTNTNVTNFTGVRDLAITFTSGAGGSSTVGVYCKCTAYALIQNVYVFGVTTSTPSFIGIVFAGGSGFGCFGNTVLGGNIQNCHVGVQFTNVGGTNCTNQTILGLNISGNSTDTTCQMYQFVNAGDGLNTTITGGFIQNYNVGLSFSGQKCVTVINVYMNGANLGVNPVDVSWSGSLASPGDQNILIVGRSDQTNGLTTNLPTPGTNNAIPNGNAWITGGGINGVQFGTGINDSSSTGLGGTGSATPLSTATASSLHATAVGSGSLAALTTGTDNTAVGRNALNGINTQTNNTAVGSACGSSVTTGSNNTFVGTSAGGTTTGSDNAAIGSGAVLGTVAGTAAGSNQFLLGDTQVATLYCKQTTITTTSDHRDKTALRPLSHGLALIRDLQVKEWEWAHRTPNALDGRTQQGFVAQDLKTVVAKHGAGALRLVDESNPDLLGATPGNALMPLIVAVQELATRLEALEKK